MIVEDFFGPTQILDIEHELLNIHWDWLDINSRSRKFVHRDARMCAVIDPIAKQRANYSYTDPETEALAPIFGITNFNDVPAINQFIRLKLLDILPRGMFTQHNLRAEANLYIGEKSYIGFHADCERRVVIGARFFDTMKLIWILYNGAVPVFEDDTQPANLSFEVPRGALYLMSETAAGHINGKTPNSIYRSKMPHFRHAACFEGYEDIVMNSVFKKYDEHK